MLRPLLWVLGQTKHPPGHLLLVFGTETTRCTVAHPCRAVCPGEAQGQQRPWVARLHSGPGGRGRSKSNTRSPCLPTALSERLMHVEDSKTLRASVLAGCLVPRGSLTEWTGLPDTRPLSLSLTQSKRHRSVPTQPRKAGHLPVRLSVWLHAQGLPHWGQVGGLSPHNRCSVAWHTPAPCAARGTPGPVRAGHTQERPARRRGLRQELHPPASWACTPHTPGL